MAYICWWLMVMADDIVVVNTTQITSPFLILPLSPSPPRQFHSNTFKPHPKSI